MSDKVNSDIGGGTHRRQGILLEAKIGVGERSRFLNEKSLTGNDKMCFEVDFKLRKRK
jgi:hypothetical protein